MEITITTKSLADCIVAGAVPELEDDLMLLESIELGKFSGLDVDLAAHIRTRAIVLYDTIARQLGFAETSVFKFPEFVKLAYTIMEKADKITGIK